MDTPGEHAVPAIRFEQDGVPIYVTALDARTHHAVSVVDTWKPQLEEDDPDQGYQRDIVSAHAKRIARFLLDEDEKKLMPTASVLSARRPLEFEPLPFDGFGDDVGVLRIRHPLYLVDGQHRDAGISMAMQENPELESFRRPAVIMENVEKLEEVRQFVTVNQTAKRIRTDLADRLLKAMGEFEGALSGWRKTALEVTDVLNETEGGPWHGRVKLPNAVGGVASQRSMTESLKPVLDGVLKGQDSETIAAALNNLWSALRHLMDEAFAEPKDHVLQKSVGTFAWHQVAAEVFLKCYQAGNNFSVQNMVDILKHAEKYVESDFWLNKRHGGEAPNYGGRGGFATLAHEIIELLPERDVVINV